MQNLLNAFSPQTWAKFAGVFSGIIFGIYWIPLRFMDEAGIHGMWAVMVFNTLSFVLLLPYIIKHRNDFFPGRRRVHLTMFAAGFAYVLYMGSFLYTEVIRALVLFYLMPIWGFIVARIFIGEPITKIRWLSMVFGLGGLIVICGVENGIPIPSNAGDWMGLCAGLIWAGVSLSMLTDKQDAINYTITFLFWGAVCAVMVALIATQSGVLAFAQWERLGSIMIWLIPMAILIIIPAAFATIYAPSQLNPGIVGLLFMTEISIGAATAALFAGEPFGVKEITGVILITLAGLLNLSEIF